MWKRLGILCCLGALLWAVEYEKNDWLYYGFWNLYNSGLTKPAVPALRKAPAEAAKWNATMRLNSYHLVNEYIGKQFYFITEYSGDDTVRLAPSFYVLKDKKEYLVWWNIPNTDSRQYFSFMGQSGLILGSIDIPEPETAEYYAQLDGEKPFKITNTSALNISDLRRGLRTDWQHDIPGEYNISAREKFNGLSGQVEFKRFYLGGLRPQAVLSPAQNEQFNKVAVNERDILVNECALPREVFRGARLPQNYYFCPDKTIAEALNYYKKYSSSFQTDPYFLKKNYLPKGANGFNIKVIAKEPELKVLNDGNLTLIGKRDPLSWTIISLGTIDSPEDLAELKGAVRLSTWYETAGLKAGYFGWQTAFIDVVQYDKNGQTIGENNSLTFPILSRTPRLENYAGVLEHEFIVAKDTVKLELLLKISGAPDTDKNKPGAVLDSLVLEKAALQKGTELLDTAKLFTAAVPLKLNSGKAIFNPAGVGLFVGDRSFTLDPQKRSIRFDLQEARDYSGFYTNIFNVANTDELEISAILDSKLKAYGSPPNWAINCLEIVYYDSNGRQVYPADSGMERYPKISAEPNTRRTGKGLFIVPRERGAQYAQIRMHFSRKNDPLTNRADNQDYFLGQASAESIVLRPALKLTGTANVLPGNGTFYDNIDGNPLSWTAQGTYIAENLPSAERKVIFENHNFGWSALKTEIDIPAQANVLRGKMSLDIQSIETNLAPWEGFGFFLEADVRVPGGAIFHYSGIPVFTVSGDQFVRLERISLPQKKELEYYIPLYHENQKIVKLYWQLALLGKGRVELLPLEPVPEASILNVELLQEPAFNPLLWSQYSLYAAGANSFQFQKSYELKTTAGTYTFSYAELLAERLSSAGLENKNISAELKNLALDEVKKTDKYEVKVLPAYGRVTTYTEFDGQVIEVSFKTSGSKDARFNLQAYIVDEKNGNVRQAPIYRLESDGRWKTIDRVFEVGAAERFVIDSSEYPGTAKGVLLTLGGFHGIVNYSDLQLNYYTKFDRKNLSGKKKKEQKLSGLGRGTVLARQALLDRLNGENLVELTGNAYPLAFFSTPAAELDTQIRAAVKSNKWNFNRGSWLYQDGKEFTLSGFTLVGETFQKWQELRRREFASAATPYWWSDIAVPPAAVPAKYEDYFLLFCAAQGQSWKKAGLNTIRVHQLFSSWSDLSEVDFNLLIRALRQWQTEGFVIIVDALPNTDFTGSYFGKDFSAKPYAEAFSNTNDLFRAALVLPEVSEQYVKPALAKILTAFKQNNFWPEEFTYANEVGFTQGYWTIDKYNPQSNSYFSRAYHFYYGRYLQQIKNDKYWQNFLAQSDKLLQEHMQSVQLKQLLTDVSALNNNLTERYYIKDTGSYVYYNILRAEILNAYPLYQTELNTLREDGYNWITHAEATGNFVEQSVQIAKENKARINKLLLKIEAEQNRVAKELQTLLSAPALRNKIKELHTAVFANKMPADYRIPAELRLEYTNSFTQYNKDQVFFTSFLLPVVFTQDVNNFVRQQQPKNRLVIGLNNDYIRDAGELLSRAYVFLNEPNTELRFNKYAHHPIGGHSMLLNPGFGNLFEEDSNIPLNLELFTPPAIYPVQLSETNYTFVGNDNAGEGAWTVMDYLKMAAQKNQILFFHAGPNAVDKPLINDYFNFGNRPYQLNTLGLIASVALHKSLDPQYVKISDFHYDRFAEKIDLQAKGLNAVAGRVLPGEELKGRGISFVYQGKRPRTNLTIVEQKLSNKETALYVFGLERNKNQKNRAGNPELIQSYGLDTIQYEHLAGLVKLSKRKITKITGYYPSGKQVDVPLKNVKQEADVTILDLTDFPGVVCYYLAQD